MTERTPVLFVFAGLPGAGKSTLAKAAAAAFGATHLRIDTIEQGLRDLCHVQVEGEGYRLAYRIAADNLRLGLDVIADSCNPIQLTRDEWRQTALDAHAACIDIEVVCSDTGEHRQRVESRRAEVAGLKLPTWAEVERREYHPWQSDRLLIDTAGRTPAQSVAELLERLTVLRAEFVRERQGP